MFGFKSKNTRKLDRLVVLSERNSRNMSDLRNVVQRIRDDVQKLAGGIGTSAADVAAAKEDARQARLELADAKAAAEVDEAKIESLEASLAAAEALEDESIESLTASANALDQFLADQGPASHDGTPGEPEAPEEGAAPPVDVPVVPEDQQEDVPQTPVDDGSVPAAPEAPVFEPEETTPVEDEIPAESNFQK